MVVDGPMFLRPVPVQIGETVEREGFVFADVLPIEAVDAVGVHNQESPFLVL